MNEVLLYIPDPVKREKIIAFTKAQGRVPYVIEPRRVNSLIGELVFDPEPFDVDRYVSQTHLAKKPEVKAPALFNMPELMVLCNMSNESVDAYLDAYRAADLPPIALKAMLTQNNILWTPYTLAAHLREEHENMRAFLKSQQ